MGAATMTAGALAGRRVVVCRAEADAAPLLDGLRRAGAEPVPVPLVARTGPADGGAALRSALDRLDRYTWLAVTSAAGVEAMVTALAGRALPPGLRVAAVGPATAAALERAGVTVHLVPSSATAADLAAAFPDLGPVAPVAPAPVVLAPLAELAGDDLAAGLRARGYRVDRVDAYRLADTPSGPVETTAAGADAVVFTSPSIVDRFLARFGPAGVPPVVVCIGPRTTARAREQGVAHPTEAVEPTVAALIAALTAALAP